MKQFFRTTAATALMMLGMNAAATDLTVYTAIESEQLKEYANEFNKAHPDIHINWVRDSTGIVTAKLLAEKNNPKADVVWGLAGTSLMIMKKEGILQPYKPKGLSKLNANFYENSASPSWVGMDAWVAAVCMNTVEAKKHGLKAPKSWKDLTKPEYKGHIIMPNPASSGTGFLDVSSWLQLFGEKKGWAFMDSLHNNIARYTHSGSKPCKLAAAGETTFGISFAYKGADLANKGAPVRLVFPSEGLGWEMEATAIIKGTKKLAAAKKLVDWSITREANVMYNKAYAVVAMDGVARPIKNYPKNIGSMLIKNDFEWAANNRKSILKEWQKRYDAKSDPKK